MDQLLFQFLTYGIIILGFLWILTDPRPNTEKYKFLIKPSRIYYYLFLIGCYISQYFLIYKYPNIKIPGGIFLTIFGLIIYISGFFIGVWAKHTMGKFWGPPGQHDAKRQRKIISRGPFSITRNPIYLALLLLASGYFLTLRSFLIFSVILLFINIQKIISVEEKLLEINFGSGYLEYKKKVPRFL